MLTQESSYENFRDRSSLDRRLMGGEFQFCDYVLKWMMVKTFSLMSLVVIICVFNLVSFQAPLLRYALLVSNLTEFDGVIQIISLQVLQFCLLAMLLLILSSISVFVMKSVTAVLTDLQCSLGCTLW